LSRNAAGDPAGADAASLADSLAELLGYRFARPSLLREALTHPSALPRRPGGRRGDGAERYERLEFLGDRVLGLVIADLLFRVFPHESEGELAKRLATLVQRDSLARVATAIGLGPLLTLSRGEAEGGGRANPTLLADACEAVIAALYLDGGLPAAAAFVARHWQPLIEEDARPPQDAKTSLQEWTQAKSLGLPEYRTVRTEGPPHEPVFAVEVRIEGHAPVQGTGRSKRAAERAAAAALLESIGAGRG
jgi:ribonuclease-3